MTDPHGNAPVIRRGAPLETAKAALVLIHGRGADAQSILELAEWIGQEGFAYLAPQAAGNTWYPHSFLEPIEQNEPYLTSALDCVRRVVDSTGLPPEKVAIAGFSQGACLSLEFAVRNPKRYGAVIAYSGGVVGPSGTVWNSEGSLAGTPVFLGCSDVDFHIPVERVHESTAVLRTLGAKVEERIYPGMGHTINEDEIGYAQALLQGLVE